MGIRNQKREVIERLDSKTLDARFSTEVQVDPGNSKRQIKGAMATDAVEGRKSHFKDELRNLSSIGPPPPLRTGRVAER